MKKPLKIFLIVAVVLILLLLVPVGIFLAIDLNDYKQTIADAVHKATGRTLTVEGKLSKSVFPWLGVKIGRVSFSNAAGFQPADFARADDIQVKVALLPLFKREIHVANVVLHGLVINLAVNKAGVSNWADLTQKSAKPAKPGPGPSKPATGAATPAALVGALVIGGIDIKDAQLRWDDQQAGALYEVDHFNLRSSEIRAGKPIHAELSLNARSNQIKATAQVAWRSDITLDLPKQRYQLANTNLTLKAQGDAIPGRQLDSELNANINADLNAETASVTGLTMKSLSLQLSGKLHSDHLLSSPRFDGHIDLASFNPRDIMKKLAITLPATADPKVLNKASAGFDIKGDMDQIGIDNLKMALDDTTISGKASVINFKQPAISYTLDVDKLNADRYLPLPAKNAATPPPTPAAAAAATAQLPLEPMRQLDVTGTLDIGHLTVSKLELGKLNTIFYAKGGQLRLHPLSAQLYDGSYDGDIKIDVRGDIPVISINEHVKDVKVEPVLSAVADYNNLSGIATINARMTTSGVDVPVIMKNLNGDADFHFSNGEIRNMDLRQKLVTAMAKYQNKTLSSDTGSGKTYFAEMNGSIIVTNGVAHNDDFTMNSHTLRATGNGDVDLPRQTIDYHLQVELLKSGLDSNNKLLQDLAGEQIPFIIDGQLNNPKFRIDSAALRKMAKKAVKRAIEKKKTQAEERVKQKIENKKQEKVEELRDKLKDRLKGLFSR